MITRHHYPNHVPCPDVHHYIQCEHQVEIEVWPATAEVYFGDERYADPATTQVRFEAAVYNAPTSRVIWEVRDTNGNPGMGVIDHMGVYHAPAKGGLKSGTTEIVCATAAHDPLRKAFAYVIIVGRGPAPAPVPTMLVLPKSAMIYYPANVSSGVHNEYMGPSNTMQLFHAVITNTRDREVIWKFNNVEQTDHCFPWIRYTASGSGNAAIVRIRAILKSNPLIWDEAELRIANYSWPGIKSSETEM
ncbi:MAG: hypothetical protein JW768_00225 [Chitinispirillaceae bacterium]|nr:hypothetical protein [Chitinispirillaceae bacterium]